MLNRTSYKKDIKKTATRHMANIDLFRNPRDQDCIFGKILKCFSKGNGRKQASEIAQKSATCASLLGIRLVGARIRLASAK